MIHHGCPHVRDDGKKVIAMALMDEYGQYRCSECKRKIIKHGQGDGTKYYDYRMSPRPELPYTAGECP